jgi:flagellar capping protein FliD
MLEEHEAFKKLIDRWIGEAEHNEEVRQRLEKTRPNIEEIHRSLKHMVRIYCDRFETLQDQLAELESQNSSLLQTKFAAKRAQLKPFVDQLCQDVRVDGEESSHKSEL